jgi:hypothetical protein
LSRRLSGSATTVIRIIMATRHYTMQVGICNSRTIATLTERARHPYVRAVSRRLLGRYCRLGPGKVNENPDRPQCGKGPMLSRDLGDDNQSAYSGG